MYNQFLSRCAEILCCTQEFDIKDFSQYVLAHNYLGHYSEIVSIIQHSFYSNIQNPYRIKYIQCIDKLIRNPYYNPIINQVISLLYYDIFVSYAQQKNQPKMEELRILWKLWEPYLNAKTLHNTRNNILKATRIDIHHMKPKSVYFLNRYHQNQVHTPKSPHSSEDKKTDIEDELNIRKEATKRVKIHNQVQVYSPYVQAPNQSSPQNYNQQNIYNAKGILNKLKHIYAHCCNRCGKSYVSLKNYQQHLQMHIQTTQLALTKLNNKVKQPSRMMLADLNQWSTYKKEIDLKNVSMYITCEEQKKHQKQKKQVQMKQQAMLVGPKCIFCRQPLNVIMNNNEWVYQKSLKTSRGQLIHTSCLQSLLEEVPTLSIANI